MFSRIRTGMRVRVKAGRAAVTGATLVASVMLAALPTISSAAPVVQAQTMQMGTDTPAASLRTTLNTLAQEHVYLAGYAFAAALGGRNDEFKIAAAAVDKNTVELGDAIGSVYGPDAQTKFLALWRAHIGFFVDYAMASAAKDDAKKAQAKTNLDGYRNDIDAFLTGANPNLPHGAVADLFAAHVNHLTGVIDDLVAGNTQAAYDMLHMAGHQTNEIMDPLSGAIAKQFPEKFAGMAAMAPAPAAAAAAATTSDTSQMGQTTAKDGKTLAGEPFPVRATFVTVWGDNAAPEWVTEHNASLAHGGM